MSKRGEMWVHGNAFFPQYPAGAGPEGTNGHRLVQVHDPAIPGNVPWSDLTGLRTGPSLRFRAQRGNQNWFHAAVPTPAIVPDPGRGDHAAIAVDAVSLHWSSTDNNILIRRILVFAWAEEHVEVLPDRRLLRPGMGGGERVPGANFFPLPRPLAPRSPGEGLPFSIGLSADVAFEVEGEITFAAAGIHFAV